MVKRGMLGTFSKSKTPLRSSSILTTLRISAGARKVLAEKQNDFEVCVFAYVLFFWYSWFLRGFNLRQKDHKLSHGGQEMKISECPPPRSPT